MTATDLVVRGGELLVAWGRRHGDLVIHDGRIASLGGRAEHRGSSAPVRTLDADGLVVVPGFLDLQCNGAGGIDLTAEPEGLWDVAAVLPRWGVTAWLPTVVSSPEGTRRRALAALAAPPACGARPSVGAVPLGWHFEGPFLAPERRAAHAAEHLVEPDLPLVDGWSAHTGVAMVTLAPELPGALDLVAALARRGVVVSLGHSSATTAQARAAADAGARAVTHLFNAMTPLHHREPGLVGVALTDERFTVGLIADGVHVDPTVVRMAAQLLGPRLALVTDAVAALGAPPLPRPSDGEPPTATGGTGAAGGAGAPGGTDAAGAADAAGGTARRRVRLGDLEAVADERSVRLPDGTLAGSVLSLDSAVANLMALAGLELEHAVHAATRAPARLLGLADQRGTLAPGAVGDVVLLDLSSGRPEVVVTVIGGVVAYDRRDPEATAR